MKLGLLLFINLLSMNLFAGIGVGYSSQGALPVELTTFSVSIQEDGALLSWSTATEVNNYGFEIERTSTSLSMSGTGSTNDNSIPSEDERWVKLGFVEGHGNSNSPKEYAFNDNILLRGKYSYKLKQIDIDGSFEYSKIVELDFGISDKFTLVQNYPNPFNPETVISYSIPVTSQVTVEVFDALGKKVKTLVNQNQEAGSYNINFNANNLSNGIYFYRIQAGSFNAIKKMILLK